jgi:hypothetical protein
MKRLLTAICLAAALVGDGQDTTLKVFLPIGTYDTVTYARIRIDSIIQPRYDTVKVLMLVSDTSVTNGRTYYIRGYYYYKYATLGNWDMVKRDYYFDRHKKPLPKNIVVWMVKE